MSADAEPISPKSAVWCLHCERAYAANEYRWDGRMRMCPYPDCEGDAVLDQWDWARVRQENPIYPASPMRGIFYPLHPGHRRQKRS